MRTTRVSRFLPLACLLAVGAPGCGGDSSTDGPSDGATGGAAGSGSAGKGGTAGAAGKGASGSAGQSGSAGKGASGQGGAAGAAGAAGKGGNAGGSAGGAAGTAGKNGGTGGVSGGGQTGGGGGTGGTTAGGAAGKAGGGAGGAGGQAAGAGGSGPCAACQPGFVCKHETCVPDLGTCTTNDDCPGDSYCDADKTCVPYGVPPDKTNDPDCKKDSLPAGVLPTMQCEWVKPADANDPTAAYSLIYTVPLVADLNLDLDKDKLQPSIVATTFVASEATTGTRGGMLRVFDGRTCEEQLRIGGPDDPEADKNRPGYGSQWVIADLDGDVGQPGGRPEIIGFHRVGFTDNNDPLTPIAFKIDTTDPAKPKLVRLWTARDCKNGNKPVYLGDNQYNYAIAAHDLDDDGVPELIVDDQVFDAKGCLLTPYKAANNLYQLGVISTVADVDLDGLPDLVRYDGIQGWDPATNTWVPKAWAMQSKMLTDGNVAVANLGAYSELPAMDGKPAVPKTAPLPEIIVVASGKVRVQTLTGEIVFGPFDVVDGGRGGPPTASDFDGDGQVEFATAASSAYTVYDPDCVKGGAAAERPGGKCDTGGKKLAEGVLWSQPSRDTSSNVTGSSLFDFDGDGSTEVVYRDECYVRVYEGKTGEVIYSAAASSGTGYEYPVIADVDGDFATEIVVTRTTTSPACPSPDPLNANSGPWSQSTGFAILRDANDRWASSRPIWNQHAYYVTNVTDDGRIPKSSEAKRNWEQPGLNNFRQNNQGSLVGLAIADLTVELQGADKLCNGVSGSTTIAAKVCNRGTNPVQDGAQVSFSLKPKSGPSTTLCDVSTAKLLVPGDCTIVSCTGVLDGLSDIAVAVDPDGKIADCHPGNNLGATARVLCGKP